MPRALVCYAEGNEAEHCSKGMDAWPRPPLLLEVPGGSLQLARRLRIPALFCSLAVLLCALLSRPYAATGICDDGSYILIARTLAETGHVVYNGGPTAMLGWQLYLGAAFIRLFGFSFTTVRMSTLFVGMLTAFLLQRSMVRAGIRECNAAFATLALVVSPLYLMLSVTYMSDIFGLLAVVVCLYGCLRALEAAQRLSSLPDGRSAASLGDPPSALADESRSSSLASKSLPVLSWLCFAVAANVVLGTARQVAWLGALVMVPSALYLFNAISPMSSRRRILLGGFAVSLTGALCVLGLMLWFSRQPYNLPEPISFSFFPVIRTLVGLDHFLLDLPFLLLPIVALFIPEIWGLGKTKPLALAGLLLGYFLAGFQLRHPQRLFLLEPTIGDWVSDLGLYTPITNGAPPVFLNTGLRVLLTVASVCGLIGLISAFISRRNPERLRTSSEPPRAEQSPRAVSGRQLLLLTVPFAVAYLLLLVHRAQYGLMDRYALELLPLAALLTVRCYQDRIRTRLPVAGWALIAVMAVYAVTLTHNGFTIYRAVVSLSAELRSAGIPDTEVDYGWPYNFVTELRHSSHLNDPRILVPSHAYQAVSPPPLPPGCEMHAFRHTPHIHPVYGLSFQPDLCYGLAPFAPAHFSRWPHRAPGTLYVVRFTPPGRLPPGLP